MYTAQYRAQIRHINRDSEIVPMVTKDDQSGAFHQLMIHQQAQNVAYSIIHTFITALPTDETVISRGL
jgi:hypothetical protein